MNKEEKLAFLADSFNQLRAQRIIRTQGEFADKLGVSPTSLSAAKNGDERYLTDSLMDRIKGLIGENSTQEEGENSILVIPTGARGGTIADFCDSVHDYDCEKVLSPVKGAELAIQVTGDSMSPEYPNGSKVLIKKINHEAFVEWGKVYVLDTENGALIKQVRKTDKPDVVECVSLNPAYQSFEVHTSYIRGWYRVLMMLALK